MLNLNFKQKSFGKIHEPRKIGNFVGFFLALGFTA